MNIKAKIKYWYLGGPLPTRERLSDTATALRAPNTFEPSISAIVAQWCVKHLMHIIATIVMAAIALFIHFDSHSPNIPTKADGTNNISEAVPVQNVHNKNPLVKLK
jgi:hypothetical protein